MTGVFLKTIMGTAGHMKMRYHLHLCACASTWFLSLRVPSVHQYMHWRVCTASLGCTMSLSERESKDGQHETASKVCTSSSLKQISSCVCMQQKDLLCHLLCPFPPPSPWISMSSLRHKHMVVKWVQILSYIILRIMKCTIKLLIQPGEVTTPKEVHDCFASVSKNKCQSWTKTKIYALL